MSTWTCSHGKKWFILGLSLLVVLKLVQLGNSSQNAVNPLAVLQSENAGSHATATILSLVPKSLQKTHFDLRPLISWSHGKPFPLGKVCVVMSYDSGLAEVAKSTTAKNKAWALHNNYTFRVKSEGEGAAHFWRYQALLKEFNTGCDTGVYFDADAYVQSLDGKLPRTSADLTLGNEFFEHSWLWASQSPFNTGFIMARNTNFTRTLFDELLHSPMCNQCRLPGGCGPHHQRDQGCLDKLVQRKKIYKNAVDNQVIAFARVQSPVPDSLYLVHHPAGTTKHKP